MGGYADTSAVNRPTLDTDVDTPSVVAWQRAREDLLQAVQSLWADEWWRFSLVDHSTIAEAVAATFAELGLVTHVAPFFVTRGHDIGPTRCAAFAVQMDATHVGVTAVSTDEVLRWSRTTPHSRARWAAPVIDGQADPEPLTDLKLVVADAISRSEPNGHVMARLSPNVDEPRLRARWGSAVSLWWDGRLAEGHTPESAHMMLALVAPPAVMAELRFDAAGVPRLPRQPVHVRAPGA